MLVRIAAASEHVELRVIAMRSLHEAGQGGAFEGGQVLAGKEPDQVGRAVDRAAVDQLHRRRVDPLIPESLRDRRDSLSVPIASRSAAGCRRWRGSRRFPDESDRPRAA